MGDDRSATPMIRSFATQAAIATVDALPAEAADRVRRRIGDVTPLRQALQIGWVPLGEHMQILEAARAVLGPAGFRAFHRDLMLAYLERPLLRGLFDTASRILGMSPQTLVRWAPRAWDALFKDCGALVVMPELEEAGCAVLELRGFPPEHFELFVEALAGSLDAIPLLTQRRGQVDVLDGSLDGPGGRARYAVRWT